MMTPPCPRLIASFMLFSIFSRAAASTVVLVGCLVLVGWMLDITTFKSIVPGLVTMKANTAVAFVLAGVSLWWLREPPTPPWKRRLAELGATVSCLVGLLTLGEYLTGQNFGIDQLLFTEGRGAVNTSSPGRMAPMTAINFVLVSVCLLMLDRGSERLQRFIQFIILVVTSISFLALVGYISDVGYFYGIASYTAMAVHTSVAFILLCAGILVVRPDRGVMAILTSDSAGGIMARRFLPALLVIPTLLGWLRLKGQHAGLYETEFGLTLYVLATIILFTVFISLNAGRLHRTDVERRLSEQERERFFNLSLDMLCVAGFDGYFKRLNPAWERTLGFTNQELLAQPYTEFIHPDDRDATFSEARKIAAGAHTLSFENRYRCKDGTYKWLSWAAVPDMDTQCIYATARDITERKRAEERFHLVVEATPNAMVMVDRNRKITLVNQQAETLFGYNRQELIGREIEMLVPERFRAQHPGYVTGFFQDPQARAMGAGRDLLGRKKNGAEVPIEIGLNPIETPEGLFALASIIDITERRLAEERIKTLNQDLAHRSIELDAANKELEAFSYSVAHDLRAPLRAVDGFSQILLEEYADRLDAEGRDSLRRIRAAAQRMAELIDDLLQLSRIARTPMGRETVDLSEMAKAILAEFRQADPNRQVVARVPDGLVTEGDPRLLEVVLSNLLENAWKFTSKNPLTCIEIGVAPHDGNQAYFVRDDGAGFDPAYAEKLFGAFQRLHGQEEFPGTGIGLATVQRVIHRHGGRVWADGAVGKGATFYFTLPRT